MTTTILLVRHGQTQWNLEERFRGRSDLPLNPAGKKQARQVARRISLQWKPAALVTSPIRRAAQTADIIGNTIHLTPLWASGLSDINYGKWQGLTPAEASEKWPDSVAQWFEHPEMAKIPGGETLLEVQNRAMAAVKEACWLHPDQAIVLVSHTVVNRLILLAILGSPIDRFWKLRQEPCAINVIEKNEDGYVLVSMNDVCHIH